MVVVAATLPVAVLALAVGWWRIALIIVVALQAGAAILVLDIRGRVLPALAAPLTEAQRRLDNVGRRMLAAVEESRLEIADWMAKGRENAAETREQTMALQGELERRLAESDERVLREIANLRKSTAETRDLAARARDDLERRWAEREKRLLDLLLPGQVRETEALLQLYHRVTPRAAMPGLGGWALDPTAVLALLDLVERRRPERVLELGSGASSVWLGYGLERLGSGRLVSIDHEERYAEATREHVHRHGLDELVEVRIAPLTDAGLPGHEALWYDVSVFDDVTDIDLLIVDGPPKATGRTSRYPALPKLVPHLSGSATVAIDDGSRPDEKAIVQRWREEFPELSEVSEATDSSLRVLLREEVDRDQRVDRQK